MVPTTKAAASATVPVAESTSAPTAPTTPTTTTAPTSTTVGARSVTDSTPVVGPAQLGVYRGPGGFNDEQLVSYIDFLGRQPDLVEDYLDVDTWANQQWPDWQSQPWQAYPQYRLVLGGACVFPEGQGSWTEAATGAYEDEWLVLGQNLVAGGQEDAIVRIAHEFNASHFHYGVTPTEVESFTEAWRRCVDTLRSVPGQRFTFDWNPIAGVWDGLPDAAQAYPGDAYVDRIALDVYDGNFYPRGWRPGVDPPPTQQIRDDVWDHIVNGPDGLERWRQFAVEHAKPLSIPEWGLQLWTTGDDGLVWGGGDNPAFIERMHAIIADPAWNVAYHAYWEQPGCGLADAVRAESCVVDPVDSRAVFLDLFST